MQDCSNTIDAKEADYLYMSASQLTASGNGLRTAIKIYMNEIIAVFKGEMLSPAQAKGRAEQGIDQYFINMPDGVIMDSMNAICFAKYANDAIGYSNSGFRNNARITLEEGNAVCLVALRDIKAGEEIFCSYGKRYWKKHGIQAAIDN